MTESKQSKKKSRQSKKKPSVSLGSANPQETKTAPPLNLEGLAQQLSDVRAGLDQLKGEKETFVTTFGLFASILAFLTIEFQFLKTLYSWEKIVGFSLILWALLLGFNIALDLLTQGRSGKEISCWHWLFYGILLGLCILGGVIASCGNEETCREEKIYQAAYRTFEKEQAKIYKGYDHKRIRS